mmetsp:Transcript_49663/g.131653  ORF Transcript_49663/g.131653 Transcript_49663/m.131653 type:complete len:177 (-) Transcript_49663:138-668(-)
MPVRIWDDQDEPGSSANLKPSNGFSPELELWWLSSAGTSTARLERCLQRNPEVNAQNDLGSTALMFACGSWSVPFVQRLLDEHADPNVEDQHGVTAMDIVKDEIRKWEENEALEREASRKRRLEMEITGVISWDRPAVEELEPFQDLWKLYEIQEALASAGAKPGENVRRSRHSQS